MLLPLLVVEFFSHPNRIIKMSSARFASKLMASAAPKVARPVARTQFASVTSKRAMSGKESSLTFATEQQQSRAPSFFANGSPIERG